MKTILVCALALLPFVGGDSSAGEYRNTITIFVENKSGFPNRVQVQDAELRAEFPEDCRIARKVSALCNGDRKRVLRPPPRENMTCAVAIALLDEPRCTFKDLIFDDWIDGWMKARLTVHTSRDGLGMVKVRALNNTESWTTKPGLRDGDTVGHQ